MGLLGVEWRHELGPCYGNQDFYQPVIFPIGPLLFPRTLRIPFTARAYYKRGVLRLNFGQKTDGLFYLIGNILPLQPHP